MATNTAPSFTEHTAPSSGSTAGPYSISFSYIDEDEVDVTVDGVLKTKNTHYTFASATTIQFTSGNNPANSAAIKFQRDTNIGAKKVDFQDGSVLTEADLDSSTDQLLFGLQELSDDYVKRDGSQTVTGNLVFEGSADDNNETTLAVTNPTDDRTITLPDTTGTVVTTGDSGTVTSTMIADGTIVNGDIANTTITGGKLVNDTVTATQIAANAVTASELADNSVDTDALQDGNVTRPKIAADAIDSTKLADDAVNSEHYVDGSIDHEHLANDIIDGDNVQDNAIDNEHIATNAVRVNEIKDGEITSAKLNPSAVITSSEQGSATTNDTSFLTSAAADARFFNISSGDTIKDGQTFPDNDTTIATTAAINDRIIDLVDDVGGFVPIANETSFPATNPDVNNGTGTIVSVSAASTNLAPSGTTVTIANGAGTGNTVTITGVTATIPSGFGFLVETTSTLHTYTFHRLSPKATEVTAVAGKATEIGRLGTTAAIEDMSILGTADVVADMAILGTTDVVADMNTLGTADVVADMNLLATNDVVSDMNALATSDNISAMDTCRDNITSINNASSNINSIANFGDQYQVNNGNPQYDGGGNPLAAGDLYFDTGASELKVYNGSAWQGGVTATGNFASVTGNTFTGDNRYNDGVKLLVGTGSDLEIFHHQTDGSFINDAGTSTLKLQVGGSTKLEIQSSGIGVTGNIVVSGNVDGRDVAADGTKLDGIEAGATADQTVTEIKSLIASSPLDASHLAANSVDSSELVDGSVDHSHLSNDCVDGDNIQDNSINSEHYVDASIDHAHLSNDCVDGDNIADDSINSEHYVDGSIDTAHIADDAIDANKLANSINSAIAANTAKDLTNLNASNLTSGTVPTARLGSGTPNNTNFLRGDGSWQVVDVPKLDTPVITGDLEVADGGTVTHTITNFSDEVTYTFSSVSNCTIGTVNTSGQFVITETGDHPSYTVKAETDSLGLGDSNTITKNIKTKLSAPTLSSPADNSTATNIVYTITSTHANDNKLILDIGSSNFTYQSVSHGTGSKVGNTVEVTGFTTNNPAVTIQFTAEATYSVTAKAQDTTGTFGDSLASAADSITIQNNYTVDFLVIAGGGGGGGHSGAPGFSAGGGGAGGYRNSYSSETSGGGASSESSLTFTPDVVYTVSVGGGGGGGSSGTSSSNNGTTGTNSSISGSDITTITSNGGGGGGARSQNGVAGGSGGGGGGNDSQKSGGSGTSGQGFAGGNTDCRAGVAGQRDGSAGGGGASAVGASTNDTKTGGSGGAGAASSITGSSVTRAGGGGGGGESAGSGGSGGGGAGGYNGGADGSVGSSNKGGGGGGGNGGNSSGGAGGSGIVILRMATANYSGTTSGSPSVTTSGSDTILTYTGNGSYTA